MDTNSWKKIIDGLDDDIVDSAAERFGSEHSNNAAGDFSDGGKPVEYKYPAKKKHWGLYIGGGSVAAAAVVAGVILLNNYGLTLSSQPMVAADSCAESSTPAETASTTPFAAYMQKSEPDIQYWLSSIETDGIDFVLFEEYFYGVWERTPEDTVDSDGEPEQIELSYGDCDLFGLQFGYTCLGTILTEDGCYMVAAGGGQYDLWYVPENDRSSLFIDRDVWVKDGQVVYVDSVLQCASTELYSCYGTGKPQEDGSLGYFGQEKLAQKMGLTTEYLFEEPAMSESTSTYPEDGSTAKNWVRTYGMRESNIWLVSQSNSKVVVTELLEDENSGVRALFDITWTNSGGEWLTTGYSVSDRIHFSSTYKSMGENEFQTFEDLFAGTWLDPAGAELTMDYTADPFEPGDSVFIYRTYDGVVLFCIGDQENTAYYIQDGEPDVMYQYADTWQSGNSVKRSEYTAVYTRSDGGFTPVEEAAGSGLGVIGFEKYVSTYSELGDVMNGLFEENPDSDWKHSFYKPGGSSFGGYTVFQTDDGSYSFSYQEYNRDTGADRWVTYTITNTVKGWITERASSDSGDHSIGLEVSDGGQSDN